MAITIQGIDNNEVYYINNPIKVTIQSDVPVQYFIVNISTPNLDTTFVEMNIYPDLDNKSIIDISPIIKSLFKEIQINNDYTTPTNYNNKETFSINFRPIVNGSGPVYTTFINTFLRGGSNDLNINQKGYSILNITDKPLFWRVSNKVLPTASYSRFGVTTIYWKTPFLNENNYVQMPVKGCENYYVKFLNSKGGFSYWLFENAILNTKTSAIGASIQYDKVIDYGVEVNNELTLTTKVDREYLEVLKQLIYSPCILILDMDKFIKENIIDFQRVVLTNNTIIDDTSNKASFVSIKLNKLHNFNPSVIW